MTKSQNTKKDLTSEQLTEQWKKGELPSGWYYLKVNEELANCPVIAECVDDYNLGLPLSYFYDFDVAKIEQILAPVPTFEEWKSAQAQLQKDGIWYTEISHKKVLRENAQLKEQIERLEKQLNKQGEQVLTMIDLLLKSYFYLSAARDCKLTLEHCGNIGILCDLINKCLKDLGK